jgi:Na+-driven multidrug efflux pump
VVIAAAASVAGIMIAQYIGKKDEKGVGRSFYTNLAVSLLVVAVY